MPNHYPLLLVSLLLLGGCTDPGDSSFAVEERDGVTHAINHGTNVWADSTAAPIQFEREQTYGTNDGSGPALLGGVAGLAVDDSGTVYVLDRENHRLVAFRPDGSVQWSAGREGEGPGEFQRPRGLLLGNNGWLYVANDLGRQIDVWATAGEYLERHTFEETDLGMLGLVGFADGHLIVSETGFGKNPQTIHALNPETWAIDHSFPLNLNLDLPEGLGISASATTIGDSIYSSGVTEYTFRQFSIDGSLGRQISRNVDFLVGPGVYSSGGSRGIRTYSSLSAPLQLPDGHLLATASWPTNVDDPDAHYRRSQNDAAEEVIPATALDLFAPNGRYRGSLRWNDRYTPPIGSPQLVGPHGKLYTTSTEPYPQVRRYEVTVQHP